jgi:hypothetical protein
MGNRGVHFCLRGFIWGLFGVLSQSADEQLNKIFAIIGTPQDSDMEELQQLATASTTLGRGISRPTLTG